jgi:hypothetical protein
VKVIRIACAIGLGLTLGCATSSAHGRDESATGAELREGATADTDSATADGTDKAKQDPNSLVCQSVRVTGSHLPKRVCRTVAQIEQEREAARKAAERAQQQGGINTGL